MRRNKVSRLLILVVMAAVMLLSGCNMFTPPPQATPEPTPMPDGTTPEPVQDAGVEATPTQDPAELLNFWLTDLDKDVYYILLLGTDLDSPESKGSTWGHNDTTMILQVDRANKTMKLVSFMRDMVVDISDSKTGKRLTDTNMYGGPEQVKRTIKKYFGIEIDYYASVSFIAFEQIMEVVGEIMINVQEHEVPNLEIVKSAVSKQGEWIGGQGTVKWAGEHKVNEYVALSYARERHAEAVDEFGNTVYGDAGRTFRQRQVVVSAWDEVKQRSTLAIPGGVFAAKVYAECDMPEGAIITLLTEMIEADASIETYAIPKFGQYWEVLENDHTGRLETRREIEENYNKAKADFEANQAASSSDSDEEDTEEAEEFPSFEQWKKDNYSSSKIGWDESRQRANLREFFNIG